MIARAVTLAQAVAVAPQSALEPAGPAAAEIARLWNVMLIVGTLVTLLVAALLAVALFRRRRPAARPPEADRPADPRGERLGTRWMLAGGVALPVLVLTAMACTLEYTGAHCPR